MGYGEAIGDLEARLGDQDTIPIEPGELIAAAEAEDSIVHDVVVEIDGGRILCGNFDSSFLFLDSSEPSMQGVLREFTDVESVKDSPFRSEQQLRPLKRPGFFMGRIAFNFLVVLCAFVLCVVCTELLFRFVADESDSYVILGAARIAVWFAFLVGVAGGLLTSRVRKSR